jgi:hypothetical protein
MDDSPEQSLMGGPEQVVDELVDDARYPVADPATPGFARLAAHCREQLDDTGCCILPGFLTPTAVARAVEEAHELAPLGHHSVIAEGSAYLEIPDPSWPSGHARTLAGPTALTAVAYDRFPPGSVVRRVYEWDALMTFLAAALGKPRLYRYADPLGALNLAVMTDGDQLWWHFDQTDFVVSIALQDADEGGDFEYVPHIRSRDDERYDEVATVLAGGGTGVVRVPMEPGTLMLFEGRHSLHQVTPIVGSTPRLVALLAYDTAPGTQSSELLKLVRYGRAG